MMRSIQERLRKCCDDIRRSNKPISEIIPLLQEAADKLDDKDRIIELLKSSINLTK
jgi:hypothetical protein